MTANAPEDYRLSMLIKKIRFKPTSCHSLGGVGSLFAHTVEHGNLFECYHMLTYTCSCFEEGSPTVAFTSVQNDAERRKTGLPLLD